MKKNTLISTFALATSIALLNGCGQKGPLYLPAKPAQTGPVELQAPTTIEKTRLRNSLVLNVVKQF